MSADTSTQPTKTCPTCGTRLNESATRCLTCGRNFAPLQRNGESKKSDVQVQRMPEITLSLPIALGLIVLVLAVGAGAVYTVLKSTEFGQHEESLVRFNHYLHENMFQCLVCHHDFRVYSNRNDGKGSKCSSCHKREPGEDIPVSLLEAFHESCIECHEKYLDWGRSAGPVECDECHGEK